MLVLALDTSTPAVTVAVADVDATAVTPLAERSVAAPNRHGELLAPLVDAALVDAGAVRADVAAVAVGVGPGPFTGLRVGVVTAAAYADALGVPTYAACSLDAVAHAVTGDRGPFAVVTDARRRQVYWAAYDALGRRTGGPDLAPPADLAAALSGRVATLVGFGALLHADAFAGYRLVDAYPRAQDVAALVAQRVRDRAPGDRLEPCYLRRPDARPPGPPKPVTAR